MPLIESDHVIQALAAQGPNEPLHVAILPRGARGNRNLYQTHSCNPPPELGSVDRIAIANQVPTARLLGKRLDHLLGGPCRRRMGGHVDVEEPASLETQHDEHVSSPKVTVDTTAKSMAIASRR